MKSVSLYFGCDSDEKRKAWMEAMKESISNPHSSPTRPTSPHATSQVASPSPRAPSPSLDKGFAQQHQQHQPPAEGGMPVIELEDVEHFFESEGEDEAFDVDAPFDEELLGEQEWFNKESAQPSTPFCSPFDPPTPTRSPVASPTRTSPQYPSVSPSPGKGVSPSEKQQNRMSSPAKGISPREKQENRMSSPAFGPESYRVAAILRDDESLIKKSKALVASSDSSSFSLRYWGGGRKGRRGGRVFFGGVCVFNVLD